MDVCEDGCTFPAHSCDKLQHADAHRVVESGPHVSSFLQPKALVLGIMKYTDMFQNELDF